MARVDTHLTASTSSIGSFFYRSSKSRAPVRYGASRASGESRFLPVRSSADDVSMIARQRAPTSAPSRVPSSSSADSTSTKASAASLTASTTRTSAQGGSTGSGSGSDSDSGAKSGGEDRPLFFSFEEEANEAEKGKGGSLLASASLLGIAVLLGGGYLARDHIKAFLDFFIDAVDDWGWWGYAAYAVVYTSLEVLAVPAIPLTMTAGVIFGPAVGTAMVSISGTVAAAIAFLLARYSLRDKVQSWASKNPRFAAIDRAIGKDGLKFVTLLRLSPLLPLAASNYLYGLTSVDLGSYVLGSWLGMLPGTYAYVSAGHIGAAVLTGEADGALGVETWQVAVGVGVTLLALGYVGNLAKKAIEEEEAAENKGGDGI